MKKTPGDLETLLSEITARLVIGDKWLCYDADNDEWTVYRRRYGERKTRTLFQGDRDGAIKVMLEEVEE